ncbi:hypothetical protein QUF90_14800 [Desulfococcaceae bacterium HSG9]|nr:hypothetical protein [Desulfococcaceae bacterium HSG9]
MIRRVDRFYVLMIRLSIGLPLFFAVASCGALPFFQDGRVIADSIAARNGWRKVTFDVQTFVITGFYKSGPKHGTTQDLTVYIEGDGRAFINRRTPSRDPTPHNPTGLRLAMADPVAPILYLSRPCQYTTQDTQRECRTAYWTSARFSQTVVNALNNALTQAKTLTPFKRLYLTGYSGGGAIAVLLAARRTDVISIITVAGNLDHRFWTDYHRITPLYDSLNSADSAQKVAHIPQVHFVGGQDTVIPVDVGYSYLLQMKKTTRSRLIVIPEMGHYQGWPAIWPALLAHYRPDLTKHS